jgi:tRNA(His) 5'-end guanylyltransferase
MRWAPSGHLIIIADGKEKNFFYRALSRHYGTDRPYEQRVRSKSREEFLDTDNRRFSAIMFSILLA